jgi:hypothetical protein
VSRFTTAYWNDSVDRFAVPGMTENSSSRIRRVLRRLDEWTLTVFNPYVHSDHR